MRTTTDKTSSAGRPWIPPLRCPPFPFCCNLRFAATLFPCYCFLCCCHSVCFLSTHPALLSLLNTWLLCVLYKCNKCCAGPAKEAGFMTMPAKASKLRAVQGRAVCSVPCPAPALATTPVVWPLAHAAAVWGLAGEAGSACQHSWLPSCMAGWQAGCRCFTPAWASVPPGLAAHPPGRQCAPCSCRPQPAEAGQEERARQCGRVKARRLSEQAHRRAAEGAAASKLAMHTASLWAKLPSLPAF